MRLVYCSTMKKYGECYYGNECYFSHNIEHMINIFYHTDILRFFSNYIIPLTQKQSNKKITQRQHIYYTRKLTWDSIKNSTYDICTCIDVRSRDIEFSRICTHDEKNQIMRPVVLFKCLTCLYKGLINIYM